MGKKMWAMAKKKMMKEMIKMKKMMKMTVTLELRVWVA